MPIVPNFVPPEFEKLWLKPWTHAASGNPEFRRLLQVHGYLTPNFSIREARCNDAAHTPVPHGLIRKARDHAFNMERLRHKLGDRPIPINSWYRTPQHNHDVGGASRSQHLQANATDITKANVDALPKFDYWANRVFSSGGFGQYPGGARHTDSRGWRARWSSFVSSVLLWVHDPFTNEEKV